MTGVQTCALPISDFVCPTPETRKAFDPDFIVWVDRIKEGRFEDTNKLFVPPDNYDYRVTTEPFDYVTYHAEEIERMVKRPRNLKRVA